jgi:hypothetical protein
MNCRTTPRRSAIAIVALAASGLGCADRSFPLRAPMARDPDLRSVHVACHREPSRKDPAHSACAPKVYRLPAIWMAADHLFFGPLTGALAMRASTEATNANSLDEVPDSAWFTNQTGAQAVRDPLVGACTPSQLLEPIAPDEKWRIDHGKTDGATAGFGVEVPGKGRYLLKADGHRQPELPSAAAVIGAAIYSAVGFNTSCEQVVYLDPAILDLAPGLHYAHSSIEDQKPFDRRALADVLDECPKKDGLVRMQASAWLPGHLIGPFLYSGTRDDDPSDVVPHEDRRELRGARLIAAWIDHVDARDANTMDSWLADAGRPDDGSPGHVVHYYLDTSDALGPEFGRGDPTNRRLGYSYLLDWDYMAADFVSLGLATRPWDQVRYVKGYELFRYFDVDHFVPDQWRMQYTNPAFSRMTERDGAWMARVLAHLTPETVRGFASMARFSNPGNTIYLARVLEGRLERILDRYLTRLSPVGDLRVDGSGRLCGVDLAERRGVRDASRFHYRAESGEGVPLAVERGERGDVCVVLPRVAGDDGMPDDAPERRVRVVLTDDVARGPLVAHLYDLGPARGYRLVGAERPDR